MFYGDPLPTSITLPLRPNDDPELTCFVCKDKRTCELCIEVHYPGCTLWYGIHFECVAIAERKKS